MDSPTGSHRDAPSHAAAGPGEVLIFDPTSHWSLHGLSELLEEASIQSVFWDGHPPLPGGWMVAVVLEHQRTDFEAAITRIGAPGPPPTILVAESDRSDPGNFDYAHGARAVICLGMSSVTTAALVRVALDGNIVVPLTSLGRGTFHSPPRPLLDSEAAILRALAVGGLDGVADQMGYSRRHAQRLVASTLHELRLPDVRAALASIHRSDS